MLALSPRPRLVGASVLLALALLCTASTAGAHPWVRLDRVLAEPSPLFDLVRLRAYVSAISLEGQVIPVSGRSPWTLRLNGAELRTPTLVTRFAGRQEPLAAVLVVCVGYDWAGDFEAVRASLLELVTALPAQTELAVIGYGETITGGRRLTPAPKQLAALEELEPDLAAGERQLLDALGRATRLLRGLEDHRRRLVLVVSDGKNTDPEPERYREVARAARREGIPIHSIAYSPLGERQPLLGLGELSKLSDGTFRWARTIEGLRAQLGNLQDEIAEQYVLTSYLPAAEVLGKRLSVGYPPLELESGSERIEALRCGVLSCAEGQWCANGRCIGTRSGTNRGWLGWVLLVIAVVAGAAGAMVWWRRNRPSTSVAPAPPGAPPAPASRAPAPAPSLLIVQGLNPGQRLPLHHGFTIGKAADCHLSLPSDGYASGHHAHILIDGSECTLVDNGSTNGTFINGVRATRARLSHGMLLRIGQTELRFLSE